MVAHRDDCDGRIVTVYSNSHFLGEEYRLQNVVSGIDDVKATLMFVGDRICRNSYEKDCKEGKKKSCHF